MTQATDWHTRFDITIYQIGWRLGGKAASGRNPEFYGRNEARGTHIWLGGFHHTLAMLARCYHELGRPLSSVTKAIQPVDQVFFGPRLGGGRGSMFDVPAGELPELGRPPAPATIWACLVRILRWTTRSICDFKKDVLTTWIESWPPPHRRRFYSSLRRAARHGLAVYRKRTGDPSQRIQTHLAAATAPDLESALLGNPATVRVWVAPLLLFIDFALTNLREQTGQNSAHLDLLELTAAIARGLVEDRLYLRADFQPLREVDFRQWLHGHRANPKVLDHPALLGLYDLLLAYRDGDTRSPALAASAALELICRGLCDSRGPLLYQFQAGPGEVVFAPIYQVLKQRGVRFAFFHRVKQLELDREGDRVERIVLARQVELLDPEAEYQPLYTVKGTPCWPTLPAYEQIVLGHEPLVQQLDFESQSGPEVEEIVLTCGHHFDHVLLGLPVDVLPAVAPDLLERSAILNASVRHLATTACEGAQLWLKAPWSALRDPTEATANSDETSHRGPTANCPSLVGFGLPQPLSQFEVRTHHVAGESWPASQWPAQAIAFSGPMPAAFLANLPASHTPIKRQALAGEHIRNHTIRWMQIHCSKLWPAIDDNAQPPWDHLVDPHERPGNRRLAAQFLWANIAPGEQQIQSLPNTEQFRLRPDASGFTNLTVAGDWTDTGLNASCAEAAVVSGLLAAEALGCRTELNWWREAAKAPGKRTSKRVPIPTRRRPPSGE